MSAKLLLESLRRLVATDLGFDPTGIISMSVAIPMP
jgi:hypothetical protein